jgi:hypothetical protein
MSLFDYPRINFEGTLQLNPGTANNDDYAANYALPASYGHFAGQPLALIDSKAVEPRTYGMSDADFIAWVQLVQTFDVVGQPGQTAQTFPAEWNYYGGMDSQSVAVFVTGAQAGPGKAGSGSLAGLVGAALTFSGVITDVNSEGSPPSTQFFFDEVMLSGGGVTYLKGAPSKGACQWLNFYRNVNQQADAGAGGYVYHVFRKGPGATINIPGFDAPGIVGAIFRYYLYRPIAINNNAQIAELYKQGKTNPVTVRVAGTLAPLYEHETIFTAPVGRLLVANQATIPTPSPQYQNNSPNGLIALAPGVVQQKGNTISADFVGTFPENYQGNPNLPDPKFDFGPVSLVVTAAGSSATIGPVDYTNVAAGNQAGWIFDFDISANPEAQKVLAHPDAVFSLQNTTLGSVLGEADYYFVSNQQGMYTEQFGSGKLFLNQGTEEPATVQVHRRGRELAADRCPPITVWQYRSVPLQSPGNAEIIATNFTPGQAIVVDTSQPGNFLFTFSIDATDVVPTSYSTFMNPPYLTNYAAISLRILPNSVDFSKYYVDPHAKEPVGNDLLTFDVVYQNVLRTYYLLYPAMNQIFALNSETAVAKPAVLKAILARTELSRWMTSDYMPRTRDMSHSRRTLLRAWCRKVLAAKG